MKKRGRITFDDNTYELSSSSISSDIFDTDVSTTSDSSDIDESHNITFLPQPKLVYKRGNNNKKSKKQTTLTKSGSISTISPPNTPKTTNIKKKRKTTKESDQTIVTVKRDMPTGYYIAGEEPYEWRGILDLFFKSIPLLEIYSYVVEFSKMTPKAASTIDCILTSSTHYDIGTLFSPTNELFSKSYACYLLGLCGEIEFIMIVEVILPCFYTILVSNYKKPHLETYVFTVPIVYFDRIVNKGIIKPTNEWIPVLSEGGDIYSLFIDKDTNQIGITVSDYRLLLKPSSEEKKSSESNYKPIIKQVKQLTGQQWSVLVPCKGNDSFTYAHNIHETTTCKCFGFYSSTQTKQRVAFFPLTVAHAYTSMPTTVMITNGIHMVSRGIVFYIEMDQALSAFRNLTTEGTKGVIYLPKYKLRKVAGEYISSQLPPIYHKPDKMPVITQTSVISSVISHNVEWIYPYPFIDETIRHLLPNNVTPCSFYSKDAFIDGTYVHSLANDKHGIPIFVPSNISSYGYAVLPFYKSIVTTGSYVVFDIPSMPILLVLNVLVYRHSTTLIVQYGQYVYPIISSKVSSLPLRAFMTFNEAVHYRSKKLFDLNCNISKASPGDIITYINHENGILQTSMIVCIKHVDPEDANNTLQSSDIVTPTVRSMNSNSLINITRDTNKRTIVRMKKPSNNNNDKLDTTRQCPDGTTSNNR